MMTPITSAEIMTPFSPFSTTSLTLTKQPEKQKKRPCNNLQTSSSLCDVPLSWYSPGLCWQLFILSAAMQQLLGTFAVLFLLMYEFVFQSSHLSTPQHLNWKSQGKLINERFGFSNMLLCFLPLPARCPRPWRCACTCRRWGRTCSGCWWARSWACRPASASRPRWPTPRRWGRPPTPARCRCPACSDSPGNAILWS